MRTISRTIEPAPPGDSDSAPKDHGLEYAGQHDFRIDDFIEATASRSGGSTERGAPLPRLVQDPDEADRAVAGPFHRQVDVPGGRLELVVEVSVDIHRAAW